MLLRKSTQMGMNADTYYLIYVDLRDVERFFYTKIRRTR